MTRHEVAQEEDSLSSTQLATKLPAYVNQARIEQYASDVCGVIAGAAPMPQRAGSTQVSAWLEIESVQAYAEALISEDRERTADAFRNALSNLVLPPLEKRTCS